MSTTNTKFDQNSSNSFRDDVYYGGNMGKACPLNTHFMHIYK